MTDDYSATPSRNTPPTLQRGKACLRCRKRKMRCDGTKPSCQQCVRAKKQDLCEYDDGKARHAHSSFVKLSPASNPVSKSSRIQTIHQPQCPSLTPTSSQSHPRIRPPPVEIPPQVFPSPHLNPPITLHQSHRLH
ncbi:hypothetical protein BJV77DRAFT_484252 [Russula vinacea]|nr:hypothetical protein BJV77DRAFT_484252 [Russula vinacea]